MHTAIFNSIVFDCHMLKGSVGQFLCFVYKLCSCICIGTELGTAVRMDRMKPCTDSWGITVCFIHTVQPPRPLTQDTIHSTYRVEKNYKCSFCLMVEASDHVYV